MRGRAAAAHLRGDDSSRHLQVLLALCLVSTIAIFVYEIDVAAGACTCPGGIPGKCCRHQVPVCKWFDEMLPNMPTTIDSDRYAAAHLALGEFTPPDAFYMSRTSTASMQSNTIC